MTTYMWKQIEMCENLKNEMCGLIILQDREEMMDNDKYKDIG